MFDMDFFSHRKLRRLAVPVLTALCATLLALPAFGANFDYKGTIDPKDNTSALLNYYVKEFSPEELSLVIDEQPDNTGLFRDLYMDLKGVIIGGVRVDNLTFRMNYVQFNAPEEWAAGNVTCSDAMQIYARCLIKEEDINKRLSEQTFGKDDHWQDISMKIAPSGMHAKGTYTAKVLFVTLDILLEVDSGLKIVKNKELWLDNYQVRVNALDVPDYVTKKAINQIQPLLDLGRFPLPLKLHKVEFQQGQALLTTKLLPEVMQNGIAYHYSAK